LLDFSQDKEFTCDKNYADLFIIYHVTINLGNKISKIPKKDTDIALISSKNGLGFRVAASTKDSNGQRKAAKTQQGYSEMALTSRTRQSALQAGNGYSVHSDIQFLKDFICGCRKDLDRLMLCGCNSLCNLALRAQACDRIENQLDGHDAMVFNDQEQFGNVLKVEIYKDKPERHTIQPAA